MLNRALKPYDDAKEEPTFYSFYYSGRLENTVVDSGRLAPSVH